MFRTALGILAFSAFSAVANAAIILNISDGNGTGPFGNITLTQVDNNTVNVQVALTPDYSFVDTGSHDTFGFNITGSPAVTFSSITAGFGAGTGFSNGFAGTFAYSITCSPTGTKPPDACASGGSSGAAGPLSFNVDRTVGNLSITDFVANAAGYTFAADVFGPKTAGGTGNFTGLVESQGSCAAGGIGCVSAVPEPITSSLVGIGLISLFFLRRHRLV
jgi:hypothetical protein